MEAVWARITAWIEGNAPQLLEVLQPGASEAQIDELEAALSVQLPEDVKALYRLCNGQASFDYGLINGNEFLSLERIQDEWRIWKGLLDTGELSYEPDRGRVDAQIRKVWWHPQWLPLTYNGAGDHDCLDLAPSEEGTRGQIITMWHDDDERKVIAPSLLAWFQDYAERLEAGQLVYSDDYDGIVDINDI